MKRQKFQNIAADALRNAGSAPKRLVALHSGAVALAFLLVALIGYGVELIPTSTGLDHFGTQSILTAIPTALKVILAVLLPIWGAGLQYSGLCIFRGEAPGRDSLLAGFRRFTPVIITVLWRVLRYALAVFVGTWCVSALIALLPMPQVAGELMAAFLDQGSLPGTWQGKLILGTYLVCYVNGILVLVMPVIYRHRLTEYLIVDDPEEGGWKAMQESRLLMRRSGMRLLRLDLGYWWYHLLDGVLLMVAFVDLLPLVGMHFPVSQTVKLLLLIGAPVLRLVLQLLVKPKLAVEYAGFFDSLLYEEPKAQQPLKPEKMPWKY